MTIIKTKTQTKLLTLSLLISLTPLVARAGFLDKAREAGDMLKVNMGEAQVRSTNPGDYSSRANCSGALKTLLQAQNPGEALDGYRIIHLPEGGMIALKKDVHYHPDRTQTTIELLKVQYADEVKADTDSDLNNPNAAEGPKKNKKIKPELVITPISKPLIEYEVIDETVLTSPHSEPLLVTLTKKDNSTSFLEIRGVNSAEKTRATIRIERSLDKISPVVVTQGNQKKLYIAAFGQEEVKGKATEYLHLIDIQSGKFGSMKLTHAIPLFSLFAKHTIKISDQKNEQTFNIIQDERTGAILIKDAHSDQIIGIISRDS